MNKYIAVAVAVILATCAGVAQGVGVSKTGTTAATFLEISVGAPAVGMGSAFVSIANDATALHWNPAGVAGLQQANVVVSRTNWIADTKFDFAAIAVPLSGFGTLGFSLTSLTMGDMKVRTVDFPEGTGEYFSAGDLAGSLSYARQLSERFSIGISAKYIQQTIWHESASAFAMDIGTLFRTDLFGGMTIGASLSNFGTSMKMNGRDARQFIRLNPAQTGTTDQIPTDVEFDSWDLPLLIQFGVSTHIYDNDMYRWTVAIDALHPNDNYESMNGGTEISYRDFLFLRAGYQSIFLKQSEGGASFGVGVSSSTIMDNMKVAFDYAYENMGKFESVHVLTLSMRF
jgi:Type IX secretion system protein PorV